jgi:hypothetical protein
LRDRTKMGTANWLLEQRKIWDFGSEA